MTTIRIYKIRMPKKYKWWHNNWNTYNTQKASTNRKLQWWFAIMNQSQIITEFKN